MPSRVFVIGAPSGAGKTTLLARVLERVAGLRFSVSHTTRAMRAGEADGRDYHFVTAAEFERRAAGGEFLEWARVYGRLYGTHRGEVERARQDGVDLLLDVDVQGARSVRARLPEATLVLILPPSWETLAARLNGRGTESAETVATRLAGARTQLDGYALYDYLVVNDDLERAAEDIAAVVRAERLRLRGREDLVKALLAT